MGVAAFAAGGAAAGAAKAEDDAATAAGIDAAASRLDSIYSMVWSVSGSRRRESHVRLTLRSTRSVGRKAFEQ